MVAPDHVISGLRQASDSVPGLRNLACGHRLNEFVILVAVFMLGVGGLRAQDSASSSQFSRSYRQVRPLLSRYCYECHAGDVTEADIDLASFKSVDDARGQLKLWQKVREMLESEQMPPKDAQQPNDAERSRLRTWVREFLTAEARATAGDPGPVVLRRLSNAEYNYTIRDLTGVASLNPTREFPVDGAAGEGFTNTGMAQGMSPSLVAKFMDAAREVAEHAALYPDGIRFTPYRSRRDLTDSALARIQSFYARYTTDGGGASVNLQGIKFDTNQGGLLPSGAYLTATIVERDAIQTGEKTIEFVAQERKLSGRYLGKLWNVLNSNSPSLLLDPIRKQWRSARQDDIPDLVEAISKWQSQLWKFNVVGHLGREGAPQSWMESVTPITDRREFRIKLPACTDGDEMSKRVAAAMEEFRQLFPIALCYTRIVPVDEVVTAVLFHREDDLLKRLMLDEQESVELDRLWDELLFVSEEPLQAVVALEQIREFSTQDRQDLVGPWDRRKPLVQARADAFRQRVLDAEPVHLQSALDFADQAWRRELTANERRALTDLYERLRKSELTHESAIRLVITRVLTSPNFLYRREKQPDGPKAAPVSDLELANRLSYFLWSSMPDEELRAVAEANRLTRGRRLGGAQPDDLAYGHGLNDQDDQLIYQTRRMLSDARTRRLAIHFACQWLHVRNFDQNAEKNERLYPRFSELRGDMYEETVRFFEEMFRQDGSILDMFDADHTFLNERLAKHYGIPEITGPEWRRVEGMRDQGRGGLLGMATVLASQSGASRTSPILRGNWVSETLLGERLPRPPANVPQLPDAVPTGLTARELIELHSSAPGCAKCHTRIDPYGFALEQFDAIGRMRDSIVDTKTTLVDGQAIDGLSGLRAYLVEDRRDAVLRQFCRKLLGYALGREIQLSDELLLQEMQNKLASSGYRFSVAVETIVTSRQFQDIRGKSFNP